VCGQRHHETRAVLAAAFERAGHLAQALAHARQAAALRRQAAAAVVADLETDAPAVLRDRNRAAGRAGVADDVGDGLPQGEGQGAILVGRERRRDRGDLRGNARRDQKLCCTV